MPNINNIPSFSIGRDMRGIYRGLYSNFPDGFPEIFVFNNLQTKIMKRLLPGGREIIYVKDDTDFEIISCISEELKHPQCQIDDGSIPITYHSLSNKEVAQRLVYACYIADSLNIELKQICFTHEEDLDGYSEQFLIFIGDVSMWDALHVIAHELRHAWQHKYYPNIYENYIHPDIDIEKYYYQPAEIDAEAFGIKLASMITGFNLTDYDFGNLTNPTYKEKIIRRMQEIDVILSAKKIREIQKIIDLDKMLDEITEE